MQLSMLPTVVTQCKKLALSTSILYGPDDRNSTCVNVVKPVTLRFIFVYFYSML